MALHRDTSRHFDQRLRLVSSVVDLDPGLDLLRAQLNDFQRSAGRPICDRLAQAVVAGEDTDLLFAAALAEAASTPALHNDVVTGVRQRLHRMIRDRYATTAVDTYLAVGAVFDAAAAKLTAAHQAVDIEADPERVLDLPDKARKLWRQAPDLAAEVDRVAEALRAAAILAGLADASTAARIAVCVDPADIPTELIFDAWTITEREDQAARDAATHTVFTTAPPVSRSRTGRWGALLAAGAVLRAATPEHLASEPAPAP